MARGEAMEPGAVLCKGPKGLALAVSSHHNGSFVGPAASWSTLSWARPSGSLPGKGSLPD